MLCVNNLSLDFPHLQSKENGNLLMEAYLDNLKLEFKPKAGTVVGTWQEIDKCLLNVHFLI